MLDSILNVIVAVLVAAACYGAGRTALLGVGVRFGSASAEVALSAGLGFGGLIYAMVALGFAGLYQSATAWGLLAALGIVALLGLWRWPLPTDLAALSSRPRKREWIAVAMASVLAVYGLAYLVVALAPTLEGDSIAGYLLTAREYARNGGIVSVDYAYTNSLPANGQMLSTFGFLLRGQVLAQLLVIWLMGLLALAAIYALGRTWLSRGTALVGIAVWYGMYSVGYLAASGKIDLAWAAFDLLAILAFSRWYFQEPQERRLGWLVLSGIFLGVALGTKHASVFTSVAFALAIAVRVWLDGGRRPQDLVRSYAAIGLPAAIAVIWVARSYGLAGTPAISTEGFVNDSGFVGFFRTLWNMSMLGNAPGTEGALGKSIGPAMLAIVPLVLILRNVDRRVWHVLGFCVLVLVMWFMGVQRARHLLPVLGLLSVVAAYVVARVIALRPPAGALLAAMIVVALGANFAAWSYINFVSIRRVDYVVGRYDLDGYLARNLPKLEWYPNGSVVALSRDELPGEARIAGLSTSNSFYLERPIYTGWIHTPEDVEDPQEFAEQLRSAGITHVLTSRFVMDARDLNDAWLAQPSFQAAYLSEIACSGGQCLYVLR